jgi:hypothetical protein
VDMIRTPSHGSSQLTIRISTRAASRTIGFDLGLAPHSSSRSQMDVVAGDGRQLPPYSGPRRTGAAFCERCLGAPYLSSRVRRQRYIAIGRSGLHLRHSDRKDWRANVDSEVVGLL